MENHSVSVCGRNDDQVVHGTVIGEEDEHRDHEGKSVPKKVKEKAKKIKDAIKKHGHGHAHDHESGSGSGDGRRYEDEGEDEDEESETDPEVHGAPMYESTENRRFALEGTTGPQRVAQQSLAESALSGNLSGNLGGHIGQSNNMRKVASASEATGSCNAGGKKTEVGPLAYDFGAMTLADKAEYGPTGSHDQFSPDEPSDGDGKTSGTGPPTSYTDKISAADICAKDGVSSQLPEGGSKVGEYGEKIKETLAPVYERVAGARGAVAAKMKEAAGGGEVRVEETKGGVRRSGKGVPVSEFLAERLRPGEGDRALSQMISDAIHKRKDVPDNPAASAAASGDGDEEVTISGSTGSRGGVVGLIKGAVAALLRGGSPASVTDEPGAGGPPEKGGAEAAVVD